MLRTILRTLLTKGGGFEDVLEDNKRAPENPLVRKDSGVFLLDKKGAPENLLGQKKSGGFLEVQSGIPENLSVERDPGSLQESSSMSLGERAILPHYSLKRYLRGESLVDVIVGSRRTSSGFLEAKYRRGDTGSARDHPMDFWAGDGYIEILLWRCGKRYNRVWEACGKYFRVSGEKGEGKKRGNPSK
jgi:hypothetical protein